MSQVLALLFAGCVEAEPPRTCAGEGAAWEERTASQVFVVRHGGRGLLVAVADGGARWDWIFDDLSMLPAGAAPFVLFDDYALGVVATGPDDAPELLLVTRHTVHRVVDGDADAVVNDVHFGDGVEHSVLTLTAAWPGNGFAWVAYTEVTGWDQGLDVWSAGLGTLDGDGLLTPVAPAVRVTSGNVSWPEGLVGGHDVAAGGFWLTSGDYADPVWFVTEAGEVEDEVALPEGLYGGPSWARLPDGRWTWFSTGSVVVWDPAAPDTFSRVADLGPAFSAGTLHATDVAGVVAVDHASGELAAQTWDGVTAGEPVVTPYTFDVCDRTEEIFDPPLAR